MNQASLELEKLPVLSRVDFRSSHDHAFVYPGRMLEHSFLTDGEQVVPASVSGVVVRRDGKKRINFLVKDPETEQIGSLDSLLEKLDVEKMEDRVPVVAYCANRNPASLFHKFNHGKDSDRRLLVVPVFNATRKGSDIVWSKKLGLRGRPYADMLTNQDVANTEIRVAVTFLTHDQLAIMHSTESAYDIVEQGTVKLEDAVEIPAIYYSAEESYAMAFDRDPARVLAIPSRERIKEEFTAEGIIQTLINRGVLQDLVQGTVHEATEFLDYYESLTDEKKDVLRDMVQTVIEQRGLHYQYERPHDTHVHEWSYNSLPTLKDLLNDYMNTGIQSRLFTNDLIMSAAKRVAVESKLYEPKRMESSPV